MNALLLAGPTASGKTALAVGLAQHLGGVVINADSMQVYRDLEHLSARPNVVGQGGVPHYLFGHVDGAERYSVGRWLDEVRELLPRLGGRLPIFCGGTGLYFKALVEGITPTPDIPLQIRAQVQSEYGVMGHLEFQKHLLKQYPQALGHLGESVDRQRLLRAAEVAYATDKVLQGWHAQQGETIVRQPYSLVLLPERAELYERIDARCAQMMTTARDEVASLMRRRLAAELPIMRCLGVRTLDAVARGARSSGDGLRDFAQETRHYAKRQLTWLRHQFDADQVIGDFGDSLHVGGVAERILSARDHLSGLGLRP